MKRLPLTENFVVIIKTSEQNSSMLYLTTHQYALGKLGSSLFGFLLPTCVQTGCHYLWVSLCNAWVKESCCCTETQMWSTCCRENNKSGNALKEKPVAEMGIAEVALTAVWCYHTSKGMQSQMTPVLLDRCPSHCNLTSACGGFRLHKLLLLSLHSLLSSFLLPFCGYRREIRGGLFWSTAL